MYALLPSIVTAADRGIYVTWGIFSVQLGNLIVILVMVLLFALALVLPFPGSRHPK
jgi:hypothetical protein